MCDYIPGTPVLHNIIMIKFQVKEKESKGNANTWILKKKTISFFQYTY